MQQVEHPYFARFSTPCATVLSRSSGLGVAVMNLSLQYPVRNPLLPNNVIFPLAVLLHCVYCYDRII